MARIENSIRWYIAQTFSGHENAVKQDLETRVNSMGMHDFIFKVLIPEETIIEKKPDGSQKEIVKQLFPGYVFIEMIVTDESWFVVRNTPNVTGFLGSSGKGAKPIPVPKEEMHKILLQQGVIVKPTYNYLIGKNVKIIDGVFKGQQGEVISVDNDKETVVISVDMFGRSTPTEVDITKIRDEYYSEDLEK